jgi:ABC-type multidrug transport system fused ATPase/permease subunit
LEIYDDLTEAAFFKGVVRSALPRLAAIAATGFLLALCTGVYGVMAGPVLKFAVSKGSVMLPEWAHILGLPSEVESQSFLFLFPPVVLGAALCKGLFGYWFVVGRIQFGHTVSRSLRERLFARLERAGADEVEGIGKGELVARFVYDIEQVERLFGDGLIRTSQAVVELSVLFLLCIGLDWQLACLFFLVYPIVLVPLARLTRRLKQESKRSQAAISTAANVFQDQLHAMRAIQSLHYPGVLRRRLNLAIRDMYHSALKAVRLKATASPIAEVMGAGALCVTVMVCGWRLSLDTVPPEASLSFIACLLLMYKPIKGVGELPQLLAPGRAALNRILRLDLGAVVQTGEIAGSSRDGIVMRNLGLKRGGRWILQDVNADFSTEQFVLVSGPNGSGKSSLVETLLGLRAINAGTLLLGGIPLAEVDIANWRAQVGWLSQEALLIQGTLLENIVMGREGYQLSDVVATWHGLGFELVGQPETFFDRELKSEGAGLSGGQRRKVLLTRACLGSPSILILDEPDAFQDAQGLESVRRLIDRVRTNRLLIVVSHDTRLGALADVHLELAHTE